MGHVANQHLPPVGAIRNQDHLRGAIANLAVREPHCHRTFIGITIRLFLVQIPRAGADVIERAGGQPRSLVVGHKHLAVHAQVHAVGGAQAARHRLPLARGGVDLVEVARAFGGGIGGFTGLLRRRVVGVAAAQGHAGADVERALERQQIERELVVIGADPPAGGHHVVFIRAVVAVGVAQARDLALLRHIEVAFPVGDAQRLAQPFGKEMGFGPARLVQVAQQIHRAALIPGAHGQAAIGQENHAPHGGAEIFAAYLFQRKAGVDGFQRAAVAGARGGGAQGGPLGAGVHHKGLAGVGGQQPGGQGAIFGFVGALPADIQAEIALVVHDEGLQVGAPHGQAILPAPQPGLAAEGAVGGVQHRFPGERHAHQGGSADLKIVGGGAVHLQAGGHLGVEVLGHRGVIGFEGAIERERRRDEVGVGHLPLHQLRDSTKRLLQLPGHHGHAGGARLGGGQQQGQQGGGHRRTSTVASAASPRVGSGRLG